MSEVTLYDVPAGQFVPYPGHHTLINTKHLALNTKDHTSEVPREVCSGLMSRA